MDVMQDGREMLVSLEHSSNVESGIDVSLSLKITEERLEHSMKMPLPMLETVEGMVK